MTPLFTKGGAGVVKKQTLYFPYDVEGSYGGEALARDVAQLRALNKQLVKIFVQR